MQVMGYGRILTNAGIIEDVYYVPKLVTNLFSIRSVTRQKIVVVYTEHDVKFIKDNKILLYGIHRNGAYILEIEVKIPKAPEAFYANTAEDWHKRLGHISVDIIKHMADHNIVGGLDINSKQKSTCLECAMAKCSHSPHPSRQHDETKPGQVLHVDTVGPITPISVNGKRYFILCKDQNSGYRMGAYILSKNEVGDQVKLMVNESKLATNNTVLKICSDNGSEFVNQHLSFYLKSLGIIHETSLPYIHQQNGLIERDVRTVVECARSLLVASTLPKLLWDEAIACSIYVLNRSTNSKNKLKTPFELWFGHKPNVSNLRIFGQNAVVYNQQYKTKFDPRGQMMKFVGYTKRSNSYRFFDGKKVLLSCDAKFLHEEPTHFQTNVQFGNSSVQSDIEVSDIHHTSNTITDSISEKNTSTDCRLSCTRFGP